MSEGGFMPNDPDGKADSRCLGAEPTSPTKVTGAGGDGEDSRCHDLKTWPRPFDAIWRGDKAFEVRKDDRGFEVGDCLHLREWDPLTLGDGYSGRWVNALVTYKVGGGEWGLPRGLCVLGIRETARTPPPRTASAPSIATGPLGDESLEIKASERAASPSATEPAESWQDELSDEATEAFATLRARLSEALRRAEEARADRDAWLTEYQERFREMDSALAAERARAQGLENAIRWACGYEVPGWPPFEPPADGARYWWRRVLMDRALSPPPGDRATTATPENTQTCAASVPSVAGASSGADTGSDGEGSRCSRCGEDRHHSNHRVTNAVMFHWFVERA